MPVKPFLLPRSVVDESGIEIVGGLPAAPLTQETEYLPLYLYEDDAFTTLAGALSSTLPFAPFLLRENDTRSAAIAGGDLPDYSDPASYLTLPAGYALTSDSVEYTVNNGQLWGAEDNLEAGEAPQIRVQATASDGVNEISFDQTVLGYVLHVDPAATPGVYEASYVVGSGVFTIPYTALVEPSQDSDTWSTSILDVSIPAIAGLSAGSSNLVFDLDVLAVQSNTAIDVTFTYTGGANGLSYTASTVKTLQLSVTAQPVSALEGILYTNDQIFVDQPLSEQVNFATLQDPANYTGLADPFVIVRGREFSTSSPLTTIVPDAAGLSYEVIVDVYEGGFASGIIFQMRERRDTQALFSVQETGDATTGVTWSYQVPDGPTGAPDSYAVTSLELDGRGPKQGLTLADLRLSETILVETHRPSMPTLLDGSGGVGSGDTITAQEPAVAGPQGVEITRQIDVLLDGVVSASDVSLPHQLTEGDMGASVALRFTYSGGGLSPLVIDSDATTLISNIGPPRYSQQLYTTQGTSRFHLGSLPDTGRRVFSAWVNPTLTSGQRLFSRNSSIGHVELRTNGSVEVKTYDNANALVYRAISPAGGFSAGTLSHICLIEDLAGGAVQLFVDGAAQSMSVITAFSPGTGVLSNAPFAFLARHGGGLEFDGQFADLALFQNGSITAAELYNDGTPPDIATLSETPLYHFGGTLTAAQINAVDTTQNAIYTAEAGNLENV
ncbi:MAG: LamG-like jellyroll fold domain-containing protein [Pseudomonadota bacterium]